MTQPDNSFRIAICDDEPQDAEYINKTVKEILQTENIDNEIFCYNSGRGLTEAIGNGVSFDLLLLDVMMPQQNGIELAAYLRKNLYDASIIFISSNREMAMYGYEVSAARYLAKPIEPKRLREALLFCFGNKKNSSILVPVNKGTRRVMTKDIKYIETHGRGCKIMCEAGELLTKTLISELENKIAGKDFIRCHQGFMINLRFIRELRTSELVLDGGVSIPVSKHRIKEVRRAVLSYLSD
ncbi:MAG: LytTR family DNA-binding domain-containing protein [Clostridiales bacterium]|nr:LytTR family DNA-binding domain-containing protein [Clostridiales bacterium]